MTLKHLYLSKNIKVLKPEDSEAKTVHESCIAIPKTVRIPNLGDFSNHPSSRKRTFADRPSNLRKCRPCAGSPGVRQQKESPGDRRSFAALTHFTENPISSPIGILLKGPIGVRHLHAVR
ncbi:hypothetical protein NPIL_384541 [Nephila pilipes]|uniref:Uncharacterized protein n=1 Tax=Nephila pilipes TaxID=299642 RepID=A0A8X6ULC6_NEPPI|nr:hypothetical protein NPIL_384541 [Nephila pilipes]